MSDNNNVSLTRGQLIEVIKKSISDAAGFVDCPATFIDNLLHDEGITTEHLYSECGCSSDVYDGKMCRGCGAE